MAAGGLDGRKELVVHSLSQGLEDLLRNSRDVRRRGEISFFKLKSAQGCLRSLV